MLKRPLQLLYPLEIREPEPPKAPSENVPIVSQDEQTSDTPMPERHPVRAAAEQANEKRSYKARTNLVKLMASRYVDIEQ